MQDEGITDPQIHHLQDLLFQGPADDRQLHGLVSCHDALGRSHRRTRARAQCVILLAECDDPPIGLVEMPFYTCCSCNGFVWRHREPILPTAVAHTDGCKGACPGTFTHSCKDPKYKVQISKIGEASPFWTKYVDNHDKAKEIFDKNTRLIDRERWDHVITLEEVVTLCQFVETRIGHDQVRAHGGTR